jgi:hypothetical protein
MQPLPPHIHPKHPSQGSKFVRKKVLRIVTKLSVKIFNSLSTEINLPRREHSMLKLLKKIDE